MHRLFLLKASYESPRLSSFFLILFSFYSSDCIIFNALSLSSLILFFCLVQSVPEALSNSSVHSLYASPPKFVWFLNMFSFSLFVEPILFLYYFPNVTKLFVCVLL